MSHSAPLPDDSPPPQFRARGALLRRLADVVCLPSSRINAFERSVTADLLIEMLRDASPDERLKVSRRLASLTEPPPQLARLLLHDEPRIARPLLEECESLSDAELLDCARTSGSEHRLLIAARKGLSEVVVEALVAAGELKAIEIMLANRDAKIGHAGLEALVVISRDAPQIVPALLRRSELRPAQAYVLFWWADPEARRTILQRFAVSREILQDAAGDIFPMAAEEGWQDPMSRKALQFIERRQRNRAAIEKSPFTSLEAAVSAAQHGMSREVAEEISYLAGLKPMTGAKLFTDPGGEPLAILCKATGLPRAALRALWRGLRRPETGEDGAPNPAFERTMIIYDTLAVDRAQTVLRYWNWSLSSAMTPELLQAIREGDDSVIDEYSLPQRAAMLAFAKELGRN
ncbi:DUF2336 domain-containing protein [Phenylobacterium sp.]|jgi:uncharacterized protein (DUF2336 family)|uniref:DUF2336 domain-containing protein n=1 Tax=Phenylobacterium sp. TaxID=1871053 RepID=UPI000C98CF2E|nr:DUF2336 domain-containing protein [Phenylobacterium sp.]MAK83813.1 hypothetical protein [Phenylobacterium sp.]|tara:strand:+ start:17772 stop:18986 length:1215 start_codon:yes stop_codon:yes gene_type:complete